MELDNKPLYTTEFFLLCLSHILFAASFNMIIPELPSYLSSLGGEDYKGLIIGLFTLSAGVSRPFSGKLTDTIGRIPVMVFGTLVCVVCSLLYPLLTSVAGFLLLRLFHGFSTGFKPTASSAFVADIVPVKRRGEAMGIMSVSMNVGSSAAPPVGSWLASAYSIDLMFYASSAAALISILILSRLREPLPNKQKFEVGHLKVTRHDILDRSAIAPGIVTIMVYFCYGFILTIVPDQSEYLGMHNKGLFFTTFTACSVLSRLVSGQVSDRVGRLPVLFVSIVLMVASILFLGYSVSAPMLLVASGCLGFSLGIAGPTVFAWAIDRSSPEARGRSLGTVYIALEIGIGSGALISAWLYDNNPENFSLAFLCSASFTMLAIPYMWAWNRREKQLRRE